MHKETVLKFVDAINKQNLPHIIGLMADGFTFIDTYGSCTDKERMKTGWQGYFDWFPDYYIMVDNYIENDEFAVVLGKASGSYLGNSEKYWELPAAWKVIVKDNQIKTWQVFCDSKKQLDSMN